MVETGSRPGYPLTHWLRPGDLDDELHRVV